MAVERKYERDVDLLLAEEISVNAAFARWLWELAGFAEQQCRIVDVLVSKTTNLGESDLIAVYENNFGERITLMIEDKIDAPLQPEQAYRYRMRGDQEVKAGTWARYLVFLCAPACYIDGCTNVTDFDRAVSFEHIADFLRATNPGKRSDYRASFLETAATRRANNWKREVDDVTELFWKTAYQLASREFPILEMKRLKVTRGSSWITFRPSDMPTRLRHIYVSMKCDRGQMDLTFSGVRAFSFCEQISHLLDTDMTVHQTGASAAIRLEVAGFVPGSDLVSLMPHVRSAFAACARLITFYRGHRKELDSAGLQASS